MRLAEIEQRFAERVSIEWKSFLLRPEPEHRDLAEFTEYTRKWERPASLEPATSFVEWSGANPPPTHSFPAALAGKVAATFGRAEHRAFSSHLFAACFTENRTISNRDVLVEVAAEAGLGADPFDQRWREREEELTAQVWGDHLSATRSSITGVPAVVVNRQWLIPGAVDTEQYAEIIQAAIEGREPR